MTWPHIYFQQIKSRHVNVETALHLMHTVSFNTVSEIDSLKLRRIKCAARNLCLTVCLIRRRKKNVFSFSLVHVASTTVPEKENINAFVLLGGKKRPSFFLLVHNASTPAPEKEKALNVFCPIRRKKSLLFFNWLPPFSLTHLDLMIAWT